MLGGGYRDLFFLGVLLAARVIRLKGARMPSIAEEVATDSRTLRWRCAGSRR